MQHLTHPGGFPSFPSFLSSLPPPFVSYLSISVSVRLELAAQNETPPLFDSIRELKWIKFDANHHLLTVRELFSPDGTLGYWITLSLKKHWFLGDVAITHGSSLWLPFQTSNIFWCCNKKYFATGMTFQTNGFAFLPPKNTKRGRIWYNILILCWPHVGEAAENGTAEHDILINFQIQVQQTSMSLQQFPTFP